MAQLIIGLLMLAMLATGVAKLAGWDPDNGVRCHYEVVAGDSVKFCTDTHTGQTTVENA